MAKTITKTTEDKPKQSTKENAKSEKSTSLITWGPGTAVIVVFVIYLVSQLVAGFIISIYPIFRHWSVARANNWLSNAVTAQFWLTVFVESFSLVMIGLFLKWKQSNFRSIGLKDHPRFKDAGWILIGFAIYYLVYIVAVEILTTLIPSFNPSAKQDIGYTPSTTYGGELWLVFISLVILPPIVEEILFRGFLYSGLKNKFRKLTAALITSAIFASLHLIEGVSGLLWIAAVDTFILSMTLIYLREKTDKLWASMGLHMLKNFVAFASLFLFHIS